MEFTPRDVDPSDKEAVKKEKRRIAQKKWRAKVREAQIAAGVVTPRRSGDSKEKDKDKDKTREKGKEKDGKTREGSGNGNGAGGGTGMTAWLGSGSGGTSASAVAGPSGLGMFFAAPVNANASGTTAQSISAPVPKHRKKGYDWDAMERQKMKGHQILSSLTKSKSVSLAPSSVLTDDEDEGRRRRGEEDEDEEDDDPAPDEPKPWRHPDEVMYYDQKMVPFSALHMDIPPTLRTTVGLVIGGWTQEVLMQYLLTSAFSIPPRDTNAFMHFTYVVPLFPGFLDTAKSDRLVAHCATGLALGEHPDFVPPSFPPRPQADPICLPRGYRIPLMFLAKFQWESLRLMLQSQNPEWEWEEYIFDVLHVARIVRIFFEEAKKAKEDGEERVQALSALVPKKAGTPGAASGSASTSGSTMGDKEKEKEKDKLTSQVPWLAHNKLRRATTVTPNTLAHSLGIGLTGAGGIGAGAGTDFQGRVQTGEFDKTWRCASLDRVLTRVYQRWLVPREWSLKGFWMDWGEEEYEIDVLRHDWARFGMKGAKGFQLYKDEISTGISAYTFLRGFGKDKESGRWIWKGSGGGTGAEAGPGAGGRGPAGGNREGKEKEKEKEKIQEKDGSLEVKREMVNDLAEEEGLEPASKMIIEPTPELLNLFKKITHPPPPVPRPPRVHRQPEPEPEAQAQAQGQPKDQGQGQARQSGDSGAQPSSAILIPAVPAATQGTTTTVVVATPYTVPASNGANGASRSQNQVQVQKSGSLGTTTTTSSNPNGAASVRMTISVPPRNVVDVKLNGSSSSVKGSSGVTTATATATSIAGGTAVNKPSTPSLTAAANTNTTTTAATNATTANNATTTTSGTAATTTSSTGGPIITIGPIKPTGRMAKFWQSTSVAKPTAVTSTTSTNSTSTSSAAVNNNGTGTSVPTTTTTTTTPGSTAAAAAAAVGIKGPVSFAPTYNDFFAATGASSSSSGSGSASASTTTGGSQSKPGSITPSTSGGTGAGAGVNANANNVNNANTNGNSTKATSIASTASMMAMVGGANPSSSSSSNTFETIAKNASAAVSAVIGGGGGSKPPAAPTAAQTTNGKRPHEDTPTNSVSSTTTSATAAAQARKGDNGETRPSKKPRTQMFPQKSAATSYLKRFTKQRDFQQKIERTATATTTTTTNKKKTPVAESDDEEDEELSESESDSEEDDNEDDEDYHEEGGASGGGGDGGNYRASRGGSTRRQLRQQQQQQQQKQKQQGDYSRDSPIAIPAGKAQSMLTKDASGSSSNAVAATTTTTTTNKRKKERNASSDGDSVAKKAKMTTSTSGNGKDKGKESAKASSTAATTSHNGVVNGKGKGREGVKPADSSSAMVVDTMPSQKSGGDNNPGSSDGGGGGGLLSEVPPGLAEFAAAYMREKNPNAPPDQLVIHPNVLLGLLQSLNPKKPPASPTQPSQSQPQQQSSQLQQQMAPSQNQSQSHTPQDASSSQQQQQQTKRKGLYVPVVSGTSGPTTSPNGLSLGIVPPPNMALSTPAAVAHPDAAGTSTLARSVNRMNTTANNPPPSPMSLPSPVPSPLRPGPPGGESPSSSALIKVPQSPGPDTSSGNLIISQRKEERLKSLHTIFLIRDLLQFLTNSTAKRKDGSGSPQITGSSTSSSTSSTREPEATTTTTAEGTSSAPMTVDERLDILAHASVALAKLLFPYRGVDLEERIQNLDKKLIQQSEMLGGIRSLTGGRGWLHVSPTAAREEPMVLESREIQTIEVDGQTTKSMKVETVSSSMGDDMAVDSPADEDVDMNAPDDMGVPDLIGGFFDGHDVYDRIMNDAADGYDLRLAAQSQGDEDDDIASTPNTSPRAKLTPALTPSGGVNGSGRIPAPLFSKGKERQSDNADQASLAEIEKMKQQMEQERSRYEEELAQLRDAVGQLKEEKQQQQQQPQKDALPSSTQRAGSQGPGSIAELELLDLKARLLALEERTRMPSPDTTERSSTPPVTSPTAEQHNNFAHAQSLTRLHQQRRSTSIVPSPLSYHPLAHLLAGEDDLDNMDDDSGPGTPLSPAGSVVFSTLQQQQPLPSTTSAGHTSERISSHSTSRASNAPPPAPTQPSAGASYVPPLPARNQRKWNMKHFGTGSKSGHGDESSPGPTTSSGGAK